MSIINSFEKSEEILKPSSLYKFKRNIDKCIVSFSPLIFNDVNKKYKLKKESISKAGFTDIDIYSFKYNGEEVLFFISPIGAPIAAILLEDVRFMFNVKHFIYFGSCGLLSDTFKANIIVPMKSYRDEGVSYHYEKANDWIKIKNYELVSKCLKENHINYMVTNNWTTDALYRETKQLSKIRKEIDGCLSVDMECASLQAVCNFRKINFYTFFFCSDVVKVDAWKEVAVKNHKQKIKQLSTFDIALFLLNYIN